MSNSNPTTTDVPQPYDVVFTNVWNGSASVNMGFCFLDTLEPSLPFRTHRALYSSTPTFVQRTNVSGSYGDNTQDFFLTVGQNDWSLGEDQKFFRGNDADGKRQYWLGSDVNVVVPGQVTLERAQQTLTFAAAVEGAWTYPTGSQIFTSSSTNLYEVSSNGTITDRGAHGCGGIVTAYTTDSTYLYISGNACTKTRRYNISAHTFADFSATPTDTLAFLNNTVYGVAGGTLSSFSTAGVASTLFIWKDGLGVALTGDQIRLWPYGGKLSILRMAKTSAGAELWEYGSSGVSKTAEFPANFTAHCFCVSNGIIFVQGMEGKVGDGLRGAIYYYANGIFGRAWSNTQYSNGTTGGGCIAPFNNGLIFTDPINNVLRFYNLATGGVSSIATYTPAGLTYLAVSDKYVLLTQAATTATFLFNSAKATTGNVSSSIIDFDSSLSKTFSGVTVDYVAATDGNGGTVDVGYQVDSVEGNYTSLATGITSGLEYTLSNITGRGLSVKVTLNKGTSTLGPTVKRVYVRAAPILQSYKQRIFILDLTGIGQSGPRRLRDDSLSPFSGHELAVKLLSAINSTKSFTVTDRFGSFTAICDPAECELMEVHAGEGDPANSGDFVARVTLRQI